MSIKDDSRIVVQGDTFIALRGVLSDGHDYINTAIKNGATKIICEEGSYEVETLVVKDTREYLINYLKDNYYDKISKMKLIGITGTNGKTTCAYLAHILLNRMGKKTSYIGTIGYYINKKIKSLNNTTPDLILLYELLLDSYNQGCEYVILEASSQGLAYKRLEGIVFDYVAFTNLTQDHLDYHITMESYALAKQMLFKKLKKGCKAIVNIDDPYKSYFMLEENQNITYGLKEGDYKITSIMQEGNRTVFKYKHDNKEIVTSTRLLGEYNLYNLMLVISLITEMGYPDVYKYVTDLQAPPGRMQFIDYNNSTIIIDYAHTPDSFTKLLEILKTIPQKNIYAVFGVGGDRDRTKRPVMMGIMTNGVDYSIITNEDPRTEDEDQIINDLLSGATNNNYLVEKDRAKAIQAGINMLKDNDILLILGKGHEEAIIMNGYKIPFNDYETVIKLIKEKVNN